jgi:hypothetical protein
MNNYPEHRVTAGAVVIGSDNRILLIHGPQRGWEFVLYTGRRYTNILHMMLSNYYYGGRC